MCRHKAVSARPAEPPHVPRCGRHLASGQSRGGGSAGGHWRPLEATGGHWTVEGRWRPPACVSTCPPLRWSGHNLYPSLAPTDQLAMTLAPPSVMSHEPNPAPSSLPHDLQAVRQWLKKQPHLPHHCDDAWLERFMYGCKYSLERTKSILDAYYTVRAAVPELFEDRDPLSQQLQNSADNLWHAMLPKLTPDGYRVTVLRLSSEQADLDLVAAGKRALMVMDVCLCESRTLSNVVVIDLQGFSAAQMAKGVPSNPTMRRILLCTQDAFPMRLAQVHFVNAPALLEKVMALAAPLLKDKLTKKFFVHSQVETLYEHVPREILPQEYGGDAGSMKQLSDAWMQKLVDYRAWFADEQARSKADESRRPNRKTSRLLTELCVDDMQGSFRKLSID
ncbi:alpha-tocopherol transfer protein-like isoform X2 [Bacillus rossius redtenbacheri]|uniref:alpha-tocopherol transfer protein-like isoform X2 n=1 Tax=Bacillus rossius redtenbacheri TaxID=93214 RepID=UPI002FDDE539